MNPLDQLKDIHLPEQVHNYPLAYGWWLLLAVIIIAMIVMIIKWRKRNLLHQAKKLALSQLSNTNSSDDIVTLLKWSACQYFPRNEIASLHGKNLQQFLQNKLETKHQEKFQNLCGQQLENKYQVIESNFEDDNLKQAAQLWLSQALPPKVSKISEQGKVSQQENINQQGVLS